MDKALLVGIDIGAGAEILATLDQAGLKISVALWAYFADYEEWRFVISSRRLDATGLRNAYGLVNTALDAADFTIESTRQLMILGRTDPFVRELRRIFGKSHNVEGMRLGGQTIGDRFIEDAYVYRIT